mmetsp:Transcript_299/g.784  ORF Transcript_299/g.784 Transcript_299/m.784 type:complete len:331 (+) Transcript_299:347-1339(+)
MLEFVLTYSHVSLLQRDVNFRAPLHDAAAHGAADALRVLLHPPPPTAAVSSCTHPLHAATGPRSAAIAASVDVRKRGEWTSLMLAAANSHTCCTKLLLAARADPLAANREGATALALAAKHGHEHTVRPLLRAVSENSACDDRSDTAALLAKAALSAARSRHNGSDACLSLLLEFCHSRDALAPVSARVNVLAARGAGGTTVVLELCERAASARLEAVFTRYAADATARDELLQQRDAIGNSTLHRAVLSEPLRSEPAQREAVARTIELIATRTSREALRALLTLCDVAGRTPLNLALARCLDNASHSVAVRELRALVSSFDNDDTILGN